MELNIEASRKVSRLIATLKDDLAYELLEPLGLEPDIAPQKRINFLDKKFNGDWSTQDYKVLWATAELAHFFSSWATPYKVPKQEISLYHLRQKIKHEELKNDNLIALELSYDPLLFIISRTPTPYRALVDKTITTDDIRDTVYWMPNLGIILAKIHEDENGELFKNIIENQLTGNFEEFRIKSLVVTKLFNTDRYINELVVSADPQISGFSGLDDIRFKGPDVKKGLAGLYRRHDIRVNIHQIGPNISIENEHLKLNIGAKLMVKSIEGMIELQMLMYPELFPTDEQINEVITQFGKVEAIEDEIMQLKRDNIDDLEAIQDEITKLNEKADEIGRLKLSTLAKEWDLDQFYVEYQLQKEIENGKIKGKFVEDSIVKK